MVSQCSFSLFIAITCGCCRIGYSLPADGSESDSEEESSAADDDNCETDCNNSKKSPKFSLQLFDLRILNLSRTTITFSIQIDLLSKIPNLKVGIKYNEFHIYAFYNNQKNNQ
jgi:hypothetical protein